MHGLLLWGDDRDEGKLAQKKSHYTCPALVASGVAGGKEGGSLLGVCNIGRPRRNATKGTSCVSGRELARLCPHLTLLTTSFSPLSLRLSHTRTGTHAHPHPSPALALLLNYTAPRTLRRRLALLPDGCRHRVGA